MKKLTCALALFASCCLLAWAMLTLIFDVRNAGRALPCFANLCITVQPVLLVLPGMAFAYYLWLWLCRKETPSRWMGFVVATMAALIVFVLPAISTSYLLMIDQVRAPNSKSVPAPSVAIFDPRLRVLLAEMRKGSNTYYLPKGLNVLGSEGQGMGSTVEGKLRDKIRSLGINIESMPAFRPGPGSSARAFLIGYAFPIPPTSSVHLAAELVSEDGAVYPLASKAGGGGGPPERSWNLWALDSLPSGVTNYALVLKEETNGIPLAEIRFNEP